MSVAVVLFVTVFLAPAFRGDILIEAGYSVGLFTIHLYSWIMLAAVLAAFFLTRRFAGKFGIPKGTAENLVLVGFFAGFVGARIHHVLSAWDFYSQNVWSTIQVWRGGLGIFGGIAGGIIAIALYARIKKLNFLTVADLLTPGLILGQAIGRWGNFFNQEAYGIPTNLPWKMFVAPEFRLERFLDFSYFHPVFLYESLWGVVVFLILLKMVKQKEVLRFPAGLIFASYLILYPLGRFFIESLRADQTLVAGLPLNQLLALVFMLAGLGLLFKTKRTAV